MSDRFPAEITIGGSIPRRLLDELAGMIASEGVSLDWQYALDKADVRTAIEAAAGRGQSVRFTDDEALCGQFEDLESWLTSRGINFDRHGDARYEYDGENAYGRGRKRPVIRNSDQSGEDLVSGKEVRRILASQAPADRTLTRIAKLAAVPPALAPVVLTDRKGKNHD